MSFGSISFIEKTNNGEGHDGWVQLHRGMTEVVEACVCVEVGGCGWGPHSKKWYMRLSSASIAKIIPYQKSFRTKNHSGFGEKTFLLVMLI